MGWVVVNRGRGPGDGVRETHTTKERMMCEGINKVETSLQYHSLPGGTGITHFIVEHGTVVRRNEVK